MSQDYKAGDFLIFQIESGYGLLRLLSIEDVNGEAVWHLRAYQEMFLDIDMADEAIKNPEAFTVTHEHMALTTRAFESTQTARMANVELNPKDLSALDVWRSSGTKEISDLSVRLLLGIR